MAKSARDAGSEIQGAGKNADASVDKLAKSVTTADSQITKMGGTILKTAVPSVGRFVKAFGRVGPVAGAAIAIVGSVGFAVEELTKKIQKGIEEGSTLDKLMKLDNPDSGILSKLAGKAAGGIASLFGANADEVRQEQEELKQTAALRAKFSQDFVNLDNLRKSSMMAVHDAEMRASVENIEQVDKLTALLEKEQSRVAALADERKLSDEESAKSAALQNALIQRRIELHNEAKNAAAAAGEAAVQALEEAMGAGKTELAGAGSSFWEAVTSSQFQHGLDELLFKTKSTGDAERKIREEQEKIVALEKAGKVTKQDYEQSAKTILGLEQKISQTLQEQRQATADRLALMRQLNEASRQANKERVGGIADKIIGPGAVGGGGGAGGGDAVLADIDALRNRQNLGDSKLARQAKAAARKALQEKLKEIDDAFDTDVAEARRLAVFGDLSPRELTDRVKAAGQVRGQDRASAMKDRKQNENEEFLDLQKKARDSVVDFAEGQGMINAKQAQVAKSIVEKLDENKRDMDEANNLLDQILARLGAQGRGGRNQRAGQR